METSWGITQRSMAGCLSRANQGSKAATSFISRLWSVISGQCAGWFHPWPLMVAAGGLVRDPGVSCAGGTGLGLTAPGTGSFSSFQVAVLLSLSSLVSSLCFVFASEKHIWTWMCDVGVDLLLFSRLWQGGGEKEFEGNSVATCCTVFILCQSHASRFCRLPED